MLLYSTAGPLTYTSSKPFEAHSALPDAAAGVGHTFVTPAGVPNFATLPSPQLLVSQNGLFAIEAADLTQRQPTHFYADPKALTRWNQALAAQGSLFQFFFDPPGTVTFTLPHAAKETTLMRVRAANLDSGRAGNDMTTTENCDVAVTEVIGSALTPLPRLGEKVPLGDGTPGQQMFAEYHVAKYLVATQAVGNLTLGAVATLRAEQDSVAQDFGQDIQALALGTLPPHTPTMAARLASVRVNQFARPTAVGQALYTGSMGNRQPAAPLPGWQIQDHSNTRNIHDPADLNRVLWGFHWGGVIATDGTDYLTLENYARNGENSAGQGDGLFYFQAYSADPGRSWHEQWALPAPHTKAFANAISFVVEPHGLNGLRYFSAGAKDNQAAVAAAANNRALQAALLQGLNYATVHLNASVIRDQYADKARLAAWIAALNARLTDPLPGWISGTSRSLAMHVHAELSRVKTA
ncbi:hypothetical protein ACFYNO_31825 [Kitasatospora sp. NPDC006697]|uniref:hypothetical protein n=1 Tax=Kitasatospora sp. NPDC006697 TaxID=3364020 RepID=UPI0036C5D27D